MTVGVDGMGLLSAVEQLRSEVHDATFPLDVPSVAKACSSQSALVKQLDDYVIPRLSSLEAPLLAVVVASPTTRTLAPRDPSQVWQDSTPGEPSRVLRVVHQNWQPCGRTQHPVLTDDGADQ